MPNHQTEVEADLAAAHRLGARRVTVTTEKAIAALALMEEGGLLRAEHVVAHAKAFRELAEKDLAEVGQRGRAALTDHLLALREAEHKFWEAFHGQAVQGVELVRAREPVQPPDSSKPTQEVKP
jgi:hypothetical protein